jgi:hypothetical protein
MSDAVLSGTALLGLRMGLAGPSLIALLAAVWAALKTSAGGHPYRFLSPTRSINCGTAADVEADGTGRRRRPSTLGSDDDEPSVVQEEAGGIGKAGLNTPPEASLQKRGRRAAPAIFLGMSLPFPTTIVSSSQLVFTPFFFFALSPQRS